MKLTLTQHELDALMRYIMEYQRYGVEPCSYDSFMHSEYWYRKCPKNHPFKVCSVIQSSKCQKYKDHCNFEKRRNKDPELILGKKLYDSEPLKFLAEEMKQVAHTSILKELAQDAYEKCLNENILIVGELEDE